MTPAQLEVWAKEHEYRCSFNRMPGADFRINVSFGDQMISYWPYSKNKTVLGETAGQPNVKTTCRSGDDFLAMVDCWFMYGSFR